MRPPLAGPIAPAVREHDARLGGLIRANPLAILVVDAQNRVEMCNAAFEALFGYREGEIAGMAIESLIVPPEYTNEASAMGRRGLDGRASQSVTQRRRKDGTLVDVELTIVPLSGDGLAGAYSIYRDLTEQRRTEHHLRAQYEVVEALAQSSTIEDAAPRVLRAVAEAVGWQVGAMWIVDKTANQLKCIELWRAAGVDAESFEAETRAGRFPRGVGPGRTWDAASPRWLVDVTKDRQFSRRATAQAAGLHAAFSFPMMLEGEVVGVVEFFTSTVLEADDTILRMFAALGQQLGEFVGRSRTQEQIERFFTMSQDLLCIAGFDGYFKRVNDAWSRVLGYTAAELLAEPFVNLVHLDDRDAANVEFARLATGGAVTMENRWRCRDGSYKWLFWNAIAKPEEQVIYAVARDDTARQLTDHQLKETLKMRNDFVSFVSHQLRTPLSGIKWMLELAANAENPEEAQSYIRDGVKSADRLIGLVNDLLEVSRLESGRLQVNLERVQLAALTHAVLGDVAALARGKGHTLVVDAPPTLPDAMLDRELLRQAMLNLISNAIKFTPPGGRIDIRIRHDDGLKWSISDSGIGIPKTAQARLFEKFYRAENAVAVDTEGTGLGLYLVRLIVERFGGTVACESEEGRGTRFHVVLPVAAGNL